MGGERDAGTREGPEALKSRREGREAGPDTLQQVVPATLLHQTRALNMCPITSQPPQAPLCSSPPRRRQAEFLCGITSFSTLNSLTGFHGISINIFF